MARQRSAKPQARAAGRVTPTGFTGLEIALATAFFSGGNKTVADVGAKGAEALAAYLRNEGPVAHRVLASWFEDRHHCLALEFINLTVHGAYVEAMEVTEPATGFAFEMATGPRKAPSMSFGADKDSGAFVWHASKDMLPRYIVPGGAVAVAFRLVDDGAKTLARSEMVGLAFRFALAGGKDADVTAKKSTRIIRARLRRAGPPYNFA